MSNNDDRGLPEIMTADEVAAFLRLDRKTVYEATQRNEIPGAFRVGRCVRFNGDALLAWTRSLEKPAPKPPPPRLVAVRVSRKR
jgi:excisionase family DNA binding protein